MADTPKRVVGPTLLTAAAATYYTVPASTTTILRSIHVANETANEVTLTLSIGVDAAGKRFYSALSIPGNASIDWSGFLVMAAAEVLQAFASVTNSLTLIVSAIEVT